MLLHFDNPYHYDTATLHKYWDDDGDQAGGSTSTAAVRPDGYLGVPALTGIGGHAFVALYPKNPGIHPVFPDFRMGGRFLFEAYPSEPRYIMAVVNQLNEIQCMLALNPDGTLSIFRGTYEQELKATNTVLSLDTFYRIGFKGKVDRFSGFAEVQLNRTIIGRTPVGNTAQSDVIPWAGFVWGLVEDSAVNHVYGMDAYGHQPDLLPALIVKIRYPDEETLINDWLPNTGTVPEAISETPPDDAATVIEASVTEQAFIVTATSIVAAFVYAAMRVALVKGGGAFRHLAHQFGVVFEGERDWPADDNDFLAVREMQYQNYIDGEPLDEARVNSTDIGGRYLD